MSRELPPRPIAKRLHSNSNLASGFLYFMESESLTKRFLREYPRNKLKYFDAGCGLLKIGKSENYLRRETEVSSQIYAGNDDWRIRIYRGEKCVFPVTAARLRETKLHKLFKGHAKCTWIRRQDMPILYNINGNDSVEIFFVPLALLDEYLYKLMTSDPRELKVLGEARIEITRLEKELNGVKTQADRHRQVAEHYKMTAAKAESAVASSKVALAASETNLGRIGEKAAWWRNVALIGWTFFVASALVPVARNFSRWWP